MWDRFKKRLKEAIFGVPPMSEKGKKMLEADPELSDAIHDVMRKKDSYGGKEVTITTSKGIYVFKIH